MARRSPKIRITARLRNSTYTRLHERAMLTKAHKQDIIEAALDFYFDHVLIVFKASVGGCTPNGLSSK